MPTLEMLQLDADRRKELSRMLEYLVRHKASVANSVFSEPIQIRIPGPGVEMTLEETSDKMYVFAALETQIAAEIDAIDKKYKEVMVSELLG